MKKWLQLLLLALTGIVILAVTLVVFFVGFWYSKKTGIDYLALAFVLIAEAALFVGVGMAVTNSRDRVFARAGVISTLGLYWLVTTLISILYKPIFGQDYNGLVTVQVIVMALALLAVIAIAAVSLAFRSRDEKEKLNGATLRNCENAVYALKGDPELKEFSKKLGDLYEALKFSDKTVALPSFENEISARVNDLCALLTGSGSEAPSGPAAGSFDEIIALIRQRNMRALQLKRGGM